MISNQKKFAIILGARPNFIKAAALLSTSHIRPDVDLKIIHTGQHFDERMSKIFFNEMKIPKPDYALEIKAEFHTEKIGKMFHEVAKVLEHERFDKVIVFGDVNSTLAGAIAASKRGVPLVHIEAGLRSHDRRMPEEINRVIIDHLSENLFASEPAGVENLKKEGIAEEKIHLVGNLMIESLEKFHSNIEACPLPEVVTWGKKKYVVVTIHRQENTDSLMQLQAILELLQALRWEIPILLPLHPGTKKKIEEFKLQRLLEGITICEPLGYFEFLKTVTESLGVITDSGGIQEETTHLGIPCCTLRDNTERPITIIQGSNKLFPATIESLDSIRHHLQHSDFVARSISLWDDKVSERIWELL